RRSLVTFVDRFRIADVLVARRRAHHPAAFHQMVILRAGERELLDRAYDLRPGAERRRVGRPDRVRIEAGAGGHPTAAGAAVPQMDGDAVVRMTDDGEQRASHRAAAIPQLDEIRDDLSVLAALKGR